MQKRREEASWPCGVRRTLYTYYPLPTSSFYPAEDRGGSGGERGKGGRDEGRKKAEEKGRSRLVLSANYFPSFGWVRRRRRRFKRPTLSLSSHMCSLASPFSTIKTMVWPLLPPLCSGLRSNSDRHAGQEGRRRRKRGREKESSF